MFDPVSAVTGFAAGIVLGLIVLYVRTNASYQSGIREGEADRIRLEERLAQQEARMQETNKQLSDTFQQLSHGALEKNNESFLRLAKTVLDRYQQGARDDLSSRQQAIEQMTKPIRERLEKFDSKLDELEKSRVGAYRAIDQQMKALLETHLPRLHSETANLVKALRQPTTRGRWGEVQLRRVVELAGMLEHCDFLEQETAHTETGRLRPDMLIRLPGGHQIIIDSKAPVDAYLTAVEAENDDTRAAALANHARQVRNHVEALGKKDYHEQFEPTPEFVVMFVPGEAFFSAALAQDPELIEYGADRRVIPASPTTLIALLKAVAYGWRQEALEQNAREVAALGKELHDRIQSLAGHWTTVGKRLDQAVGAYNTSVNVLENRVLTSTRRFQELRAAPDHSEIDSASPIERGVRSLSAPEMTGADND